MSLGRRTGRTSRFCSPSCAGSSTLRARATGAAISLRPPRPLARGSFGSLELDRIAPLLDWFNVMTYDYHSGSAIAHFNAPLHAATNDPTPYYNIDSTVAVYRRGGVPSGKIVIGAPFYGRAYGGVHGANGGLFQAASPAPREWATGLDYRQIASRNLTAQGFTRFWHPEALVPWLHNDSLGVFITYDDAESIGHKAEYVRAHGLGGIMIWEIGGDDGTLLAVIGDRLRTAR